MDRIHGRLPDGTVVEGVEVFRRLYAAVGFGPLVALTRLPGVSQLLDLAYHAFAKNRLRLTGRCVDGACELHTKLSAGTISNAHLRIGSGPYATYLQHTAPIDPGNSGGPLLDAAGALLGINTLKITGRDGVGLAIPSSRLALALLRAEEPLVFTPLHAEAVCDAALTLFYGVAPHQSLVSRISASLDTTEPLDAEASVYRSRIRVAEDTPADARQADAYAKLRVRLAGWGGVPQLAQCSDVAEATPGRFVGRFPTRKGPHTMTFAAESGALRVVAVD
jgi:hypothetical protein